MMNFGPIKLLFTAVAALLILGPRRLPSALRSLSRAVATIRKAGSQVTEELRTSFDAEPEPASGPRPVTPVRTDPEELRPGPRL